MSKKCYKFKHTYIPGAGKVEFITFQNSILAVSTAKTSRAWASSTARSPSLSKAKTSRALASSTARSPSLSKAKTSPPKKINKISYRHVSMIYTFDVNVIILE